MTKSYESLDEDDDSLVISPWLFSHENNNNNNNNEVPKTSSVPAFTDEITVRRVYALAR